ncbi:phosphotransferase enzyme family protein [Patulibacter sp. S7RM1-6]
MTTVDTDRPTAEDEAFAADAQRRFGLGDARRTFVRRGQNSVYRLEDPDGRRLALRLHPPGQSDPAAVRSELAWMTALRDEAGVRTPRPLPGDDGDVVQEVRTAEGRTTLAVAVTWLEGEPLADADRPELWRGLGELMGRIHAHGREWVRPSWFVRPSWDARAFVGSAPRWGPPEDLPEWDGEDLALLRAARDELADRLGRLGTGPDRYGLVHGDLMFGNVLVGPDGAPSVIDFDDSGESWYALELAVALYPFEGEPAFAARRDALVAGYRAVAPLPDELLRELPALVLARRLATLGWMAARLDTAHARQHRSWRVATTPESIRRFLAWSRRTPALG